MLAKCSCKGRIRLGWVWAVQNLCRGVAEEERRGEHLPTASQVGQVQTEAVGVGWGLVEARLSAQLNQE
jgi:hypothetical protein